MIAKASTPFSGVKAFVITAWIQVKIFFSTGFHDREGSDTAESSESFTIMAGCGAGGVVRVGWRG
jgi:hypothetical protein